MRPTDSQIVSGKNKRKVRGMLKFPTPPPAVPKKKLKKSNPGLIPKKKKDKQQRNKKAKKPAPVLPPKLPRPEELQGDLDSVFLKKFRMEKAEADKVPTQKFIDEFEREISRFGKLSRTKCLKRRPQFRAALLEVYNGTQHADRCARMISPRLLREEWVKVVQRGLSELQAKAKEKVKRKQARKSPPTPVVDAFMQSLKKQNPHPLGEQDPETDDDDGEYTVSSISSFSDSSDNEEEEHGPADPAPTAKDADDVDKYVPLKLDAETRANMQLMDQYKTPKDVKERTATWLADNICFGSTHAWKPNWRTDLQT